MFGAYGPSSRAFILRTLTNNAPQLRERQPSTPPQPDASHRHTGLTPEGGVDPPGVEVAALAASGAPSLT